jgi:hypothetical protein
MTWLGTSNAGGFDVLPTTFTVTACLDVSPTAGVSGGINLMFYPPAGVTFFIGDPLIAR